MSATFEVVGEHVERDVRGNLSVPAARFCFAQWLLHKPPVRPLDRFYVKHGRKVDRFDRLKSVPPQVR